MRVLVTGAGGMLAHALVAELRGRGHEVIALDRAALDVTRAAAVEECVAVAAPEVVVHCAAYTKVDAAETQEEEAFRVNAEATGYVARACQKHGALLVYPSTDYVFAGSASRPYRPEDATAPLNAYGRSKLAGEGAAQQAGKALVVRTSWLYGAGGPNFVDTMLRLARERDRLEVVDDQWGRPTWTGSLARVIVELLEGGAVGTFHATDGGDAVNWCGFAREILAYSRLSAQVVPISAAALARPAARPVYSVLDCTATEAVLGRPLADWKRALASYLDRGLHGGAEPSRV